MIIFVFVQGLNQSWIISRYPDMWDSLILLFAAIERMLTDSRGETSGEDWMPVRSNELPRKATYYARKVCRADQDPVIRRLAMVVAVVGRNPVTS
jgi:hypothetical protein